MNTSMEMTLAGVKALYAEGLSPEKLMAGLREKALAFDEHNIFIHLLDAEELAPYIEKLRHMDPETSPLWGIPFVLKDNMDLAGIATTAACVEFSYTPDTTAHVVQRLIDQGALPLGKANLDQFATGLNGTRSPWGPCHNSFDPALVSGGSSSGSAVAVALGLATFSLGTDTAGSGRIPACFNNLVGVKPSIGLLSATGVVPACRSLDCVSIFALQCDDANTILAAAEGYDDNDGYSRENPYSNRQHTYGRYGNPLTLGVIAKTQLKFFGDQTYKAAYEQTLSRLESSGITLQEIDYSPFDEAARLLYEGPWVAERYVATLPLIEDQPEALFPVVRSIIEGGAKPTAADLFKAKYRLNVLAQRCNDVLSTVDALLTPTAGRHFSIEEMLAEPLQRNSELGYYMNFVNLLDMAAIAVPTALTSKGLPFGVTLSAPAFTDRRLLSIANRMQSQASLGLGAVNMTLSALSDTTVTRLDLMQVVVCGAHLQGLPLNHQLLERGATLVRQTTTSDQYRLYALDEDPVLRPALVKTESKGACIDVEVWQLPSCEVGGFLQHIGAPLGLGKVELKDGEQVTGFIAEPTALIGANDITAYGGWRTFLSSRTR
ncbi:MAG: allophanate hydrolase [Granulosicoccus sp.]